MILLMQTRLLDMRLLMIFRILPVEGYAPLDHLLIIR